MNFIEKIIFIATSSFLSGNDVNLAELKKIKN